MNYNFFANGVDKIQLLDFIFSETDIQVFDLYSEFDKEVSQYGISTEVTEKFDLENGRQSSVTFQLWSPRFGGEVGFRRIELNPKSCNGHTCRYRTEGWGLIQLYLGGRNQNRLYHSNIGHFEEKGASKWKEVEKEKGAIDQWNWKEIKSTSGKLRRQVQKMAVEKIGGYGVMRGASELKKSGVEFDI